MRLLDTNIFLEILLGQSRAADCRGFIEDHLGDVCISQFSLHSIGVILFRLNRPDVFRRFIADVLPVVDLVGLDADRYQEVLKFREIGGFDFDDAYQCAVAAAHGLTLVTMDQDFARLSARPPQVEFL